jgi:ring-1,2-phenylacetyl-CoA epoxidase subunit PaaE
MTEVAAHKKIIITRIIRETPDTRTFELETISGEPLAYQPGQFLTLIFPKKNGTSERRSFSFSSSPVLGEKAAITIKRIDNGAYSRPFIDRAQVGDVFEYSGVSGFFTLPEQMGDYRQFIFFAAGSGISPVFSLIKTLLAQYPESHILLIYSNRSSKDTIFYRQLSELMQSHSGHFYIEFIFSSGKDLLKSRLSNSLITETLEKHKRDNWGATYFYLCGPFEYMDTVSITLLTESVPKENIRKENFSSFRPEIKVHPPDTSPHRVHILLGAQAYEITVQYPDSILSCALAAGIPLPYSCESGQCGSCVAICTKGRVWMAYNEVLTEQELSQGMTLTCVGFPAGGDADITFHRKSSF